MQKKLQYLVFATFILCLIKISYAASPMLYFVDKVDSTLHVCTVQEEKNLNDCKKLYRVPQINSVAVSPDGHNVFFSTESNEVYGCIRENDGGLSYCKPESSKFNNPQGMAFDRTHYLYVTNEGNKSISVCSFTSHGTIHDCHRVKYFDSSPASIAISSNDEYAYITFSETKQIAICQIHIIHESIRFGECKFNQNPEYFKKPISVAADPLHKYIYILDGEIINSGISCTLEIWGNSFERCKANIIDPNNNTDLPSRIGSAMDILPIKYRGQRIINSFVAVGTGINYCKIESNKYSCQHTNAEGYGHINSVAYATNFIYH